MTSETMSGDATDPWRGGAPEELDETEILVNRYLDGELSEEERRAFDERLEEDESLREVYDAYTDVVGDVRSLPYEFAPDDFSDRVRDRIRHRSRGQLFTDDEFASYRRTPYEVVAVVMFIIMVSAYLFFLVPPDRNMKPADDKQLEVPPETQQQSVPGRPPASHPDR